MGGLRGERPEVPLHRVVAQAARGQTLLRTDEVRELDGVTQEEDGRVVADEVVVAFSGVEAQREATHVTPGVGGAQLARNGREPQQRLGLGARLEDGSLGVLGNIVGHREVAKSASALGVRTPLDDVLAVEVSQCLDQVHIVQDDRAISTDRQGMRVALGDSTSGGLGRVGRR